MGEICNLFKSKKSSHLNLCMLGNVSCFCRLLTFFKINIFKKLFKNTIRVSNGFNPDLS